MSKEPPKETRFDFTRRAFLEHSGFAGGAMMLAGQAADVARGEQRQEATPEGDRGIDEEALVHLGIEQARLVQAMAARIFPSDELGPGAVEAGVVYFIDGQLNSDWGVGDKWYMEAPFVNQFEGATPNQGWQSNLTPAEAYRFALGWIQEYSNQRFGSNFTELSPEQQDQVLTGLEEDDPDNFQSVTPSEFFTLFRTNVLEGVYCDPIYGGNRGMVGWRLKRFPGSPGALGSYRQLIGRDEFIRIPPRSVEDDVEATGVETGTGGEAGSAHSHSHNHGPRYELEEDVGEQEDVESRGESQESAHADAEVDRDA